MKEFLKKKFGEERGNELWEKQQKKYDELLAAATPKSKQKQKVFEEMLLPRIAMYKTLLEEGFSREDALKFMEDHVVEWCAPDLKKKYEGMDRLPFGFGLFKFGFTHIVPSSDLWEADIEKGRDAFSVTMKKCFWHDTDVEYGCPEVCRYSCQCDDITYSDLKHIKYDRTETLGTGGTCCDFHFSKRK